MMAGCDPGPVLSREEMALLSAASRSAGSTQHGTDTLIGAGMRVDGHVAFTGVLRVQGEVRGDVASQGDADDTVVVDATGSVGGAVGAARIVVRGRVLGPLHSARSIDIQPGGRVVGDVFYRQIVIHADGLVEGILTPALPPESRVEVANRQAPVAESEGARLGLRAALLGVAGLALAVAAVVWLNRPPATPGPPAAETAAQEAAVPPPAVRAAAEPAASPAPAANTDARAPGRPESPPPPAAGVEEVVTVQGVNPAKPAGAFLLVSKEPAVLYRKKREEAGEGTRLVVPRGKTLSVAIGRNELFRVAEGRDLEIFYQGRKVAPKTIEAGAWMRFVPQGARAAGEGRPAESEVGAAR